MITAANLQIVKIFAVSTSQKRSICIEWFFAQRCQTYSHGIVCKAVHTSWAAADPQGPAHNVNRNVCEFLRREYNENKYSLSNNYGKENGKNSCVEQKIRTYVFLISARLHNAWSKTESLDGRAVITC